jgi:internalin A
LCLYLNNNYRLTNIGPLADLTDLTDLSLNGCTRLENVDSLASLTNLTDLDLRGCARLENVDALAGLIDLKHLRLDGCSSLRYFLPVKSILSNLTWLEVRHTQFRDLHPSVCLGDLYGNAIDSVRHYFSALESGAQPDPEIKVFVLGNGGAGKTTLIGRLRGQAFESIPAISTEGIHLMNHSMQDASFPHPIELNFWDFGGQDIYHGTHALFLSSKAIYILLYSKKAENDCEYEDNGVLIKNRHLKYWFDYLMQTAGENGNMSCPLLLIQSMCDSAKDEDRLPPYHPSNGFPNISRLLHVSSKGRGRGLDNILEHLREAIVQLLHAHPQPPLPTSWSNVRRELIAMREGGLQRTISLSDFTSICKKHGCSGDEVSLCGALHEMSIVFYREGMFGDQIIIDQSWALDAIYTIFSRHEQFRSSCPFSEIGLFAATSIR